MSIGTQDIGSQLAIRTQTAAVIRANNTILKGLEYIRKEIQEQTQYQKRKDSLKEGKEARELFQQRKIAEKAKAIRAGKKPKDSPEKIQEKILAELQKLHKSIKQNNRGRIAPDATKSKAKAKKADAKKVAPPQPKKG